MSASAPKQARRDHAGHIRRMRDGRPHVLLKLAASADGKAGAAGRKPVAITGERARERVHLLRAHSDAIMIGIGTALADDPILTCRLPGMAGYSPVRVVLDGTLRLPHEFASGAQRARGPALDRNRLLRRLPAPRRRWKPQARPFSPCRASMAGSIWRLCFTFSPSAVSAG